MLSQKKSRSNQKKKIVVKLTGLTLKKLLVRLKINPKLMATIKMAPIVLLVTKKKKQQTVGLSNTRFFLKTLGLIFDQIRHGDESTIWYLKKLKLSRIQNSNEGFANNYPILNFLIENLYQRIFSGKVFL